MTDQQKALLMKLGVLITKLEYTHNEIPCHTQMRPAGPEPEIKIRGEFVIDENRFGSMCNLIKIVDMICESDNPVVEQQFHHLVTLLNLTE